MQYVWKSAKLLISIHSLRVEGDISACSYQLVYVFISIHSLRVEGDT